MNFAGAKYSHEKNISNFLAALQAEFSEHMIRFREHRNSKDEVLEGGWYSEERMRVDLKYSPKLNCIFC